MDEQAVTPKTCMNCGTELQGVYCYRCGQKDQHRRVPLKHLLHDVMHDLWHFDSKVLGTLWLLVRRPGFLAAEYLEGKRVRHVPPFRLYVVVSFITFALLALSMSIVKRKEESPQAKATAQAIADETKRKLVETHPEIAAAYAEKEKRKQERKAKGPDTSGFEARVTKAAEKPEVLQKLFLSGLSKAMFVLMPCFAGLLHLMHRRRKENWFVDHMVLSLHFHTVCFLALLAFMAIDLLPDGFWACLPVTALFFAPMAWLAAALQHLYSRGWKKSLLKATLVLATHGIAVSVTMGIVFWLVLPK